LCFATAANAIVGVAWITDGAWRLTLIVAEPALDAASVAALDAPAVAAAILEPLWPGVGACGCTAGI